MELGQRTTGDLQNWDWSLVHCMDIIDSICYMKWSDRAWMMLALPRSPR